MNEIWKDIKGFEGYYQISNLGRVKSLSRLSVQNHLLPEKILKTCTAQGGYLEVFLYIDGKRYHKKPHKLVADAFIPNPDNLPEVDHINTDKNNNCVDNLRWCTHIGNYENPLTRQKLSEIRIGQKWKPSQYESKCIKIHVLKDEQIVHTFNSYTELTNKSEEIFGVKLWDYYARRVINGTMDSYHGYTFQVA